MSFLSQIAGPVMLVAGAFLLILASALLRDLRAKRDAHFSRIEDEDETAIDEKLSS